ncbi:MAG: alkaline phosphatase family protein [Planctomycetota bacterium]
MRVLLVIPLLAACAGEAAHVLSTTARVGRHGDQQVTPVNQELRPHGTFVDLPGLRPQVLALLPDSTSLLVSGKTNELWVLDPTTGAVRQKVPFPGDAQAAPPPAGTHALSPDRHDQCSYTGIAVGKDLVYLSDVTGAIKVFAFDAAGVVRASHTIPLPPANAPRRDEEIPSGLALSADGTRLYVCANLSNRLLELELPSGRIGRAFPCGTAPYDVVLTGDRAFVSNWGGRRPGPGDATGPAGRGTEVRVDPVRRIADDGSVTVVDLAHGAVVAETPTGLHSCALAVAPFGDYVVCANAGSDTLSVLDGTSGALLDTIWCRPTPADLLQASPNALAFCPGGDELFVAFGSLNAIGVFHFEPEERGRSALRGMIPVGWYPGAVQFDSTRGRLAVANIKGLGFGRPRKDGGGVEFNSHQYHGSVSLVPLPKKAELAQLSQRVADNARAAAVQQALLPPRPGQPPRAIPERIGEPSPIRHVVYVLKENRTYDQVLGDVARGNGDPGLCTFGRRITPNQHALAETFVLLDNTYCAGILSADGHQWSTSAFATDYMEKSFAGFPRSYPDGMDEDDKDALAYAPSGFLWDHAIARGLSLRNYGEFCQPMVHWRDPARTGDIAFADCLATWRGENDAVVFGCTPVIESLIPFTPATCVGWDMTVPDQYRADFVLKELAEFEQQGDYPALTIVCLPQDHTSGTKQGCPTPAACVADNDLALGRIVAALSRSSFWPHMAIFVIEDDPQAGWDHVSGYRTTAYVASPYCRRGVTVSTQYNTTSIVRTIEQILGLPVMNVFDASATPLSDCFTDVPDLTPFAALPSDVPLDAMNPAPAAIADEQLRRDAEVSATLDFAHVDRAPEDVLNRILWRAMRGGSAPYPDWAVRGDDGDG